jgi:CRP/FNR family transcriptional regulator, cyclic AMP receptor protein
MEIPAAAGSRPRLMDAPVTLAELRDIPLFGALSDELLGAFTPTLTTEWVAPGHIVFHEGDPARCLYVLLEGEVEVVKKTRSAHEHRVAILGPKDCFGEMSLIDVQPRSATVRALGPSRILRIGSEDFDRLYRQDMKAYALVILNIARDLSRRLRVADGILAEFASTVADRFPKPRRPEGR